MNTAIKMFLNLVVIGSFSGAVLAGVFSVADPMIRANKEKELKEAIFKVLPEAKNIKTVKKELGAGNPVVVYIGLDETQKPVGVAFKADGVGFQGNVGVMVGLNLDYLKLKGIEILDQTETPGLGDRIRESAFKDQFNGVEAQPMVEYIKYRKPEKPNQIQAITGATISSNAVVSNINKAVEKVLKAFPKAEDLSKAASEEQKQAPEVRHGR
ncbi:MAG TPA: electron transporter RnfG [Deltaproteobacteria bacterium]|nr:MAG: hypothetical protein A2Z79_06620 [Deltaproteobacteria bacterium GWA2_55_82]OGQ63312.1 MAG: hypothetical protein A3I81_00980 [Deltaproteobacteria bacterium RIFCSPLOWO2_02_FULL_55_12]OIJ73148.1 MAG: hypothetical protein A2V21_302045 [Deltaproteobacteria bacterium GWC2_55_46]HBG45598.1 electron transporter RnfG [Deltaproteobacteria bacterium]HCY10429.1 electron transporter RnfG [Deltaproteobacteria bacterium]